MKQNTTIALGVLAIMALPAAGYAFRPKARSIVQGITSNENLNQRLGRIPRGMSYLATSAKVAEALVGIGAIDDNRGPEVDELCIIMGNSQSGSGSPWCAKFASAVAVLASAISGKSIEAFTGSGSVARLWSKNNRRGVYGDSDNFSGSTTLGIPREDFRTVILNKHWNPKGAILLRARLSQSSSNRDAIFRGSSLQGHALIVVGHRVEGGMLVLEMVSGNTSGSGEHAGRRGMVGYSEIVEGDSEWRRTVGMIVPRAQELPRSFR